MNSISRDPIYNAINNGIRRDINVAIENKCYRSTIILIYCGIDAMAYLSRPKTHEYSKPQDFKNWVEKYFHVEGETKITPDEWWVARNGWVHAYTIFSNKNRSTRSLAYMVEGYPYVRYNPKVTPALVMVDIPGMRDMFFTGIDKFLSDSLSNPSKKQLIEERLHELCLVIPF